MKKSLKKWIKKNRKEIDKHIKKDCPHNYINNDNERKYHIYNNACLYMWAEMNNVKL